MLAWGRPSAKNIRYEVVYNERGGYVPLTYSKTKGQPCPERGTPIEKISYLGGSCYLCPDCQR